MDWFAGLQPQTQAALISAVVSAVVALLLAVINPFTQRQLEGHKNKLSAELEDKKASLQGELARETAMAQGAVKREIELQLGERAAQREYEYEARQRLYLAIGPLRFQLFLACRDCTGRITGHGLRERYGLDLDGYYGRNTLYRLLRPLAILEVIERQVAYSDFAIDEGARDCLRLKKSFVRIWSGDEVVNNHPNVDWSRQVEHVYAGSLIRAANALVCEAPGTTERVMRFDEFSTGSGEEWLGRLAPFPTLISTFEIRKKPILWVRLVAYGHACNNFINRAGAALGFETEDFRTADLLKVCEDPHIVQHLDEYAAVIAANALVKL